jgi:tRNA1(Val) A37 N6-methylase TrmN6
VIADAENTEQRQDQTVDAFLGGLVILVQPRKGHRAGHDAALLQALVPANAAGHAIDLGAGVGTVAFCVAARAPGLRVTGVELDRTLVEHGLAALARPENARFSERVRLVEADASDAATLRERLVGDGDSVDWVLMNPPFDTPTSVRASPDPSRRMAHVGESGLLAAWTKTAATILKAGGALGLIHRAEALPAVLAALSKRFGDIRVLPVHPSATHPAIRILVRARLGSGASMVLAPGLFLHEADGRPTGEADAILRGRSELAF